MTFMYKWMEDNVLDARLFLLGFDMLFCLIADKLVLKKGADKF
jgi:hypothetical protein